MSCVFTCNAVTSVCKISISPVCIAMVTSCAACDALLVVIYVANPAAVVVANANAEYATGPSPASPLLPLGPCGPVGPVGPPDGPGGPVAPVAPGGPPDGPGGPVAPVAP